MRATARARTRITEARMHPENVLPKCQVSAPLPIGQRWQICCSARHLHAEATTSQAEPKINTGVTTSRHRRCMVLCTKKAHSKLSSNPQNNRNKESKRLPFVQLEDRMGELHANGEKSARAHSTITSLGTKFDLSENSRNSFRAVWQSHSSRSPIFHT